MDENSVVSLSKIIEKLSLNSNNKYLSNGELDKLIAFFSQVKHKPKVEASENKQALEELLLSSLKTPASSEIFRAVKICQVWSHVFSLPDFELSSKLADSFLEWMKCSMREINDEYFPEILSCLGEAVLIPQIKLSEKLQFFLGNDGIVWSFLSRKTSTERDLAILDIICNFSQCTLEPEFANISKDALHNCMKTAIKRLEEVANSGSLTVTNSKVAVLCICTIENLLYSFHSQWTTELGKILSLIKAFIFFGLPGHPLNPVPLVPNSVPLIETPSQKDTPIKTPKLRKKRTKTLTTKDIDDYDSDNQKSSTGVRPDLLSWRANNKISSSDSEVSDSEPARSQREREFQAKVRAAALSAIATFLKSSDRRVVLSYWAAFVPDSLNVSSGNRSLITPILKDPSRKVRCSACNTLAVALQVGQPILATACEGEGRSSAFIPFSSSLAEMAVTIHRSLLLALAAEQSTAAVLQLLKCLGTAASVLPFGKLARGLITKTVQQCLPHLDHKDLDARVACLSVFRIMASRHSTSRETLEIFTKDLGIDQSASGAISSPKRCWLIERCLNAATLPSAETANHHSSHKLECLLALGEIPKENLELAYPHLGDIVDVLCENLKEDSDSLIQIRAAKSLTLVFSSIQHEISKEEDPCGISLVSRDQAVALWTRLLKKGLPIALQSQRSPALRAEACSLLATQGSACFECLSRELRMLCVTLLLGSCGDPDAAVRAAAVRAIGFAVSYSILNEDPAFLVDSSELILNLLKDSNSLVSLNASWALGNLADVLDKNMSVLKDEFPASFIWNLIGAATTAAQGPMKVRVNAVRALGNLLKNIQDLPEPNSPEELSVSSAVSVLIKNITTGNLMKNRWNACYAVGNVFRNDSLITSSITWRTQLIDTLSVTAATCKNFKVRIAAAYSLSLISEREVWGLSFAKTWGNLVSSLGNRDQGMAFGEYQHRESLTRQICCTLSKMLSCTSPEDLPTVSELTTGHYEQVADSFEKVSRTILPEKMECLVEAKEKLDAMRSKNLNYVQESALSMLRALYTPLEKLLPVHLDA